MLRALDGEKSDVNDSIRILVHAAWSSDYVGGTAGQCSKYSLSLPRVPLIDFTLSNARRFYSSMRNPTGVKGLTKLTLFTSKNIWCSTEYNL